MISALKSLRLRLCDPNIANRKISYNPSLVVVYFYNIMFNCTHLASEKKRFMIKCETPPK